MRPTTGPKVARSARLAAKLPEFLVEAASVVFAAARARAEPAEARRERRERVEALAAELTPHLL